MMDDFTVVAGELFPAVARRCRRAPRHLLTKSFILLPKYITMEVPFYFNSGERTDGLVASLVREAVRGTSDFLYWVVFDGPSVPSGL